MRTPAIAALGVVAFAAFLVATAPARFIAARVAAQAPEIEFLDAQGTLWRGNAKLRVATPGGPFVLDLVDWRFVPAELVAGKLAFDTNVASGGLDARVRVARGLTSWELSALDANARAGLAATLFPLAGTWRPEGTVNITSPALAWDGRELRGAIYLDWKDAAVALSEVKPLGSYRLEVRGEGPAAPVKLLTTAGALRMTGQGTLTLPSRFTFSGEARGEGESARALEPLLELLGPRRADGARALEVRR